MADEPENLTLIDLRRIDAKVDGLAAELREIRGTPIQTRYGSPYRAFNCAADLTSEAASASLTPGCSQAPSQASRYARPTG